MTFSSSQQSERDQDQTGCEYRGDIKAATSSHSNRSNHEQRRRGGQTGYGASFVQNRSRTDKTNARDDLRGYSRVLAQVDDRQFVRQDRKHRRSKAYKHVGTEAGWL